MHLLQFCYFVVYANEDRIPIGIIPASNFVSDREHAAWRLEDGDFCYRSLLSCIDMRLRGSEQVSESKFSHRGFLDNCQIFISSSSLGQPFAEMSEVTSRSSLTAAVRSCVDSDCPGIYIRQKKPLSAHDAYRGNTPSDQASIYSQNHDDDETSSKTLSDASDEDFRPQNDDDDETSSKTLSDASDEDFRTQNSDDDETLSKTLSNASDEDAHPQASRPLESVNGSVDPGIVDAPVHRVNKRKRANGDDHDDPVVAWRRFFDNTATGTQSAQHAVLSDANAMLSDACTKLSDARTELGEARTVLTDARATLNDTRALLSDTRAILSDVRTVLSDVRSSLPAMV